ncbi:hypothetical protein SAMN04490181_5275 [Pseudomonas brenneri]|uniref:Transposase n=1 Tax=Pseudomonas brenneri TaxID=129817 RepID=A0ABY0WK28_9PSED|nr:hypothetical protein SAMN04490181_5275 [Pseudomonas brenneri]
MDCPQEVGHKSNFLGCSHEQVFRSIQAHRCSGLPGGWQRVQNSRSAICSGLQPAAALGLRVPEAWSVQPAQTRPGQRYSATYKRSVLEYMHKHQLSSRQTAAHFGLGQSSQIGIWARQHYSGSLALPIPKRKKPTAMSKKPYPIKPTTSDDTDKSRDQLLAELEWLRMENAYLKKLEELKAQERSRPKKP